MSVLSSDKTIIYSTYSSILFTINSSAKLLPRALSCANAKCSTVDISAYTTTGTHNDNASDDVIPAPNGNVFRNTDDRDRSYRIDRCIDMYVYMFLFLKEGSC